MPARALLLDLDGTLADSLDCMRSVYFRFLSLHGISETAGDFEEMNGPPLSLIVERLRVRHNLSRSHPELLDEYSSLIDDVYDLTNPMPGASELLRLAFQLGWRIGVVTSNHENRTSRWLAKHGLLQFVADITGQTGAGRGKPFPDPYLNALQHLGCGSEISYAVEDSLQGAQAALSAGLSTFLLGSFQRTGNELDKAVPIDSLYDVVKALHLVIE